MHIATLDHFVLTVRDIDATVAFYTTVLDMKVVTFGQKRIALRYGTQKINLHELGKELEPRAIHPTPGSADLCFLTTDSISDVMKHLESRHIEIIEGPVKRTGALGDILSVYFRDPDMNLIEVAKPMQ